MQQQNFYGLETADTALSTELFQRKQVIWDELKPGERDYVVRKLAGPVQQYDQPQDSCGRQINDVLISKGILRFLETNGCETYGVVDLNHKNKRKVPSTDVNHDNCPLPQKKSCRADESRFCSPQKSNIHQLEECLKWWNDHPGERCGINQAFTFHEMLSEEDIRRICESKESIEKEFTSKESNDKIGKNSKVTTQTFKGMKLVTKMCLCKSQEKESISVNEIVIPLRHKEVDNIVKIMGVFICPNYVCIVMKYAGPSLSHLMREGNRDFKEYCTKQMEDIYQDLCQLVVFLNRHGISHNDIKPDNICATRADAGYKLVLIDFGSAHTTQDYPKFLPQCTPEYIPPRQLKGLSDALTPGFKEQQANNPLPGLFSGFGFYKDKVDFWAISMLVNSLMCQEHPYFITGVCDPNWRKNIQDTPTRVKYFKQLSENINDSWVNYKLWPMLPLTGKSFNFIQCLRANLIVDRDKWSIEPTLEFIQGQAKKCKGILNLRVTNKVSNDEVQCLFQSLPSFSAPALVQTDSQTPNPPRSGFKICPNSPHTTDPAYNQQAGVPGAFGLALRNKDVPSALGRDNMNCCPSHASRPIVASKTSGQVGPFQEQNYVPFTFLKPRPTNEKASYKVHPEETISQARLLSGQVNSARACGMAGQGGGYQQENGVSHMIANGNRLCKVMRVPRHLLESVSLGNEQVHSKRSGIVIQEGVQFIQSGSPLKSSQPEFHKQASPHTKGQKSAFELSSYTEPRPEMQCTGQVGIAPTNQSDAKAGYVIGISGAVIERSVSPSPSRSKAVGMKSRTRPVPESLPEEKMPHGQADPSALVKMSSQIIPAAKPVSELPTKGQTSAPSRQRNISEALQMKPSRQTNTSQMIPVERPQKPTNGQGMTNPEQREIFEILSFKSPPGFSDSVHAIDPWSGPSAQWSNISHGMKRMLPASEVPEGQIFHGPAGPSTQRQRGFFQMMPIKRPQLASIGPNVSQVLIRKESMLESSGSVQAINLSDLFAQGSNIAFQGIKQMQPIQIFHRQDGFPCQQPRVMDQNQEVQN